MKMTIEKLENASSTLISIRHPKRMELIKTLGANELNVTTIYKKLQIDQVTASHHLKVLKKAGLLFSRKTGKEVFYSVNEENFKKVQSFIRSF